jgi:LPXTG-motif cell wall-anchored protein
MRIAHGRLRRADPRPLALTIALLAALPAAAGAQATESLCHATGNPDAPYELITVPEGGIDAHFGHPDDIIPAPAGGCPGAAAQATPTPTPVPAEPVPPPPTVTPAPDIVPQATATPARPRSRPRAQSAPVQTQSEAEPLTATSPTIALATGALPATGSEVWLTAAFGLSFLLAGSGLRLLSRRPSA